MRFAMIWLRFVFKLLISLFLRFDYSPILSMCFEFITAFGTLLTGLAALLAVWFGYRSMQHQTRNAATTNWIQSFRNASADYLSLADDVYPKCNKEIAQSYMRAAIGFRLFLSVRRESQRILINEIDVFSQFLMNDKISFEDYHKSFPNYFRKMVLCFENVIFEAEKSF